MTLRLLRNSNNINQDIDYLALDESRLNEMSGSEKVTYSRYYLFEDRYLAEQRMPF